MDANHSFHLCDTHRHISISIYIYVYLRISRIIIPKLNSLNAIIKRLLQDGEEKWENKWKLDDKIVANFAQKLTKNPEEEAEDGGGEEAAEKKRKLHKI